jgi:RimK family alpha-L-glutamate ligase
MTVQPRETRPAGALRPLREVSRAVRSQTAVSGPVGLLGSVANETNVKLVREWRTCGVDAMLLTPLEPAPEVPPGGVVVGRLDVLPTLDGVEPGLLALLWLERRGTRVLNRAFALLAAHDKLLTARRLQLAGLPHPRIAVLRRKEPVPLEPPLVLKPRFGSWGRDVFLCRDHVALERTLRAVRGRRWFRRHGALLQELVPPRGYDLRLVVAGTEIVGAAERVARPGEWRTNVSLGGALRPAAPPPEACSLAVAAAAAVGADLVGVDLVPLAAGGYVVLELNGAVDFDERYALDGQSVYAEAARALGFEAP